MRAHRLLVAVLALAAIATAAQAAEGPTVRTPKNGDRLGPSVDVKGSLGHYGLIVIITDVYNAQTNAKMTSVPGIRHYTEPDGTFAFQIAAPRNVHSDAVPVKYKIRVFEMKGKDAPGPETVIACEPADQ
jgi:hypothetical protein